MDFSSWLSPWLCFCSSQWSTHYNHPANKKGTKWKIAIGNLHEYHFSENKNKGLWSRKYFEMGIDLYGHFFRFIYVLWDKGSNTVCAHIYSYIQQEQILLETVGFFFLHILLPNADCDEWLLARKELSQWNKPFASCESTKIIVIINITYFVFYSRFQLDYIVISEERTFLHATYK